MAKKQSESGIPINCAYDELVPIDEVKPNPRNPNKHPRRQIDLLSKIMQSQGWRAPVTVSTLSGFVVRGHGRLEAARRLGLQAVPVDYQDYENEAQETADLVADNKIAELAHFDDEQLAELLKEIDAELEIDFSGFDQKEFDKLLEKIGVQEEKPEVEFSEELLLEHNYVVLYFDNPFDWNVAVEKFGLKKVKDLTPRKGQPTGIGRVVAGADWLDRIRGVNE